MCALRVTLGAVILAVVINPGIAVDPPEPVVLYGHAKAVSTLAWASDSKAIATASDDRTIRVWDSTTGRQTASITEVARMGYGSPVVAFTADLKTVAVNYWGEVTIRSLADSKVLLKIDPVLDRGQKSAFRPDVFAMAFSPDGKRLATAGSVAAVGGPHGLPGGIMIIWDMGTGKIVNKSDKLSTSASSVIWSPNGKLVAAGTSGAGGELQEAGEVHVWDADSWNIIRAFSVKPNAEYGEWSSAAEVAFSPDGKRIAVLVTAGSRGAPAGIIIADKGASLRIWDLDTGKDMQLVQGIKSVRGLAFSSDGKLLAVASDKVIRLWSLEPNKELVALQCPGRVGGVEFSPDARSLAAGIEDGSVLIWSMAEMK